MANESQTAEVPRVIIAAVLFSVVAELYAIDLGYHQFAVGMASGVLLMTLAFLIVFCSKKKDEEDAKAN